MNSSVFLTYHPKVLLTVVSKQWFEFGLEIQFRYPLLPQFYLSFTFFYLNLNLCNQERKSSRKRKLSGRISGPSKPLKNKHFGADIHDPKARTSTTLRDFQNFSQKNFGLNFHFRFNLNLTSASSGISNHGLKTTVYRPLGLALCVCRSACVAKILSWNCRRSLKLHI